MRLAPFVEALLLDHDFVLAAVVAEGDGLHFIVFQDDGPLLVDRRWCGAGGIVLQVADENRGGRPLKAITGGGRPQASGDKGRFGGRPAKGQALPPPPPPRRPPSGSGGEGSG